MVAALVMACGVAWAASISCPNRAGSLCVGTNNKDTMTGRNRADEMRARDGADLLRARGGDDTLFGQDGPDTLNGGPDKDTLSGGKGKDALKGGDSDDIYDFAINDWGNDTITDATNSDTDPLTGNFAQFGFPNPLTTGLTINLTSSANAPEVKNGALTGTVNWSNNAIDSVYVGSGSTDPTVIIRSTITGNAAANQLIAKGGEDTVNAGPGNDWISVANDGGGDTVDCGDGADQVFADPGDTLISC
jgi:Ca2+-binding RTX toxin-like protein